MARAKRVRRVRRRAVSRRPSTAPQAEEPIGFAEEYQHVVADLRRIFILAGVMLALLIVLALVLR
jgi:hypothetical protein